MNPGQQAQMPMNGAQKAHFDKLVQSETRFFNQIFKACDFAKRPAKLDFLDGMCETGALGLTIAKKLRQDMPELAARTAFYFNDIRTDPQMKSTLRESEGTFIKGNICRMDRLAKQQFDIIAIRYGLSRLHKDDVVPAVNSLFKSMLPGGRLVIADTAALTAQGAQGLVEVCLKNIELFKIAGNREDDYIPTAFDLKFVINAAGFTNMTVEEGERRTTSTIEWQARSKPDGHRASLIRKMTDTIREVCGKNKAFEEEFQVSFDGQDAVLQIPRIIVSADR